MAIDKLLKSNGVAKPRLGYGRDSTVITMKTVVHLHLLSILHYYGLRILRMNLLLLDLLDLGLVRRVCRDAQILPKLRLRQVSVQVVTSVSYVLRLLAAERSQLVSLLWILVDLLQVCLIVASHILEVSYIV